jgi:CheY-like chemotaxis protein
MRVVALPAGAAVGDEGKCVDAHCNDHVAQPFGLIGLQALIERLSSSAEIG